MSFISDILNPITQASNSGVGHFTDNAQIQQQFGNAQAQLGQQNAFVQALQQQYNPAMQAQLLQQQQGLADQLQQSANGQGPNPAAAALAQATAANTQQQAAMMGSQRNAGANTALLARQAGMQGAANQQNAAGQMASMTAQQQLAARQQLMQQQQSMMGNVQNQAGQIQQGMANSAGQNANLYGTMIGAANQQNQTQAGINQGNAQRQAGMIGGLINSGGAAMGMFAEGGQVPGQAMVEGDSYANDTVDAKLSPGEIVIPRSILDGKDPHKAAADFVAAILKKKPEAKQAYAEGGQVAAPNSLEGAYNQYIKPPIDATLDFLRVPQKGEQGYYDVAKEVKATHMVDPEREAKNATAQAPALPSQQELQNIQLQQNMQNQMMSQMPQQKNFGDQLQQAVNQQSAGIQGMADAQGQLSREKAGIAQEQQKQTKALMDNYSSQYNKLDSERMQLMNDIKEAKIDPKRYTNSMSGGEKVGTAIGLLLSGMGSGLAGQPNMAMDFLNKQIDRDINAQQQNMNKQQNMMSMLQQQFGNVKDASMAAKVFYTDLYAQRIEEAAAKSGSAMAKAQAQQAIGQLKQQVAPMQAELAYRQAIFNGVKSGQVGGSQAISAIVPKELQGEAMKQYEEYEHTRKAVQDVNKAMQDISKLQSVGSRASSPIQSTSQIKALETSILSKTKEMFGGLSDNEIKLVHNNIPTLTDSAATSQKKIQTINRLFESKTATPILKDYGIPLQPLISPSVNVQVNANTRK